MLQNNSFLRALTENVFPVPGSPTKRKDLFGFDPISLKKSELVIYVDISSNLFFKDSSPRTCLRRG